MAITFAELLSTTTAMNPREAISDDNTIDRAKCVTPLITEITMSGETAPRKLALTGKPGAGYVRVSTERQKDDGFSIEEQISRIIHYFVEREQSFVIYNDASLSGFYPPQDARLIRLMVDKHAERYERNFRTIFLDGKGIKHYKPAQRASMENHLKEALKTIRKAADVIFTDTGEITLIGRKGKITYRPAFTLLLKDFGKYDVLAVSDLSRLYRNEAIAHELDAILNKDGCTLRIEGLIETLDFLNRGKSDEFGARMQKWFFGFIAEKFLNQVTVNTLRGTLQMLEKGKPHGKLPYFLTRKDGNAVWKVDAKESILRLKTLVETPHPETGLRRSYIEISEIMRAEPHPKLGHKTDWNRRIITGMLSNLMLAGKQVHFGLEFDIPGISIMDMEEFVALQAILDNTKKLNARHKAKLKRTELPNEQGELETVCFMATGLLRCICGGRMCHHAAPASTNIGKAEHRKYDAYMCVKQIENKNPEIRHSRFSTPDVHRFIAGMIKHYQELATHLQDDSAHEALKAQVLTAQEEAIARQMELDRVKEQLRERFTAQADAEGFEGNELDDYVSLRIRNATKRERQTLEEAELRRDALQDELALYTSNSEAERINAKIEQWDTLADTEQNAIVRRIFNRWETRGTDPDCYIVPILRNGRELAPIRLITHVQQFKNRDRANYLRRLPDPDGWYQDAKKQLMGGEWFGEVVGFQYREDIPDDPLALAAIGEDRDTVTVVDWEDGE